MVDLIILFELYILSRDLNTDFDLKDYLFGTVKLTKNVDTDKYKYSRNSIGFDLFSEFSVVDKR